MIIDELFEGPQLCPECGGISFSDLILAEKKDACYYKVKASAKVWPSAYASGRLVQCRKKGAANYGNKSEGVEEDISRRGFLQGMGAAAAAGAAGSAIAAPFKHSQSVDPMTDKVQGRSSTVASDDGSAKLYIQWNNGAWFDLNQGMVGFSSASDSSPLQTMRIKLGNNPVQNIGGVVSKNFKSIQIGINPDDVKQLASTILKHSGELRLEVLLADGNRKVFKFTIEPDATSRSIKEQGVAEGVTPASTSKVLRLIDRHNPEWFEDYGMGEVEDTVVELAERGEFQGMSAVDAMALVHQELEKYYGHDREQGMTEGKNTNPRVNEIRQLAKDFFGYKPYSSGTIQGGKILRLSFPFNRSLSTFYHSVPLTQVSPQDQQLLKKLKSDFEQFMASNGVSADEVSMKFHTGAGVYASVRIAIPQEQGVAEGLSDTQKKIEDTINKLEDRLKHAKSGEQWDRISARIERLQAGLNRSKQGVAEGYDSEELANEVYAEFERIYPNLARKANERTVHAAVMDVLNYGGDSNPSALAQDVARAVKQDLQQGVAEANLSELNKDTVYSYAKKAHKDQDKQSTITGKAYLDNDPKTANKAHHKFSMRAAGLDRAEKRLKKQGVAEGSEEYCDACDRVITKKPHVCPGSQGVAEEQELDEKWSQKYKSSINCANPKGFSQRAHCAGRNKNEDVEELDEGGDVFMPNIKNTPEYKAGFATGKLPVPHPEGTQEYASYYKGVIDRASPTLAKVGEGEQQKGADYRDPKEVDYDDEYDAMVARVKKLAGLGPMKTVYDPAKRQYRNMPTAVQPKK